MVTVPLSADQRTTPLHPADVNRRLPAGGNHHPRQLRRQAETGGTGGNPLRAVPLDEGFGDNSARPGHDLLVSGHGRHNRRASFLFKGGPTARSEPPPAGPRSLMGAAQPATTLGMILAQPPPSGNTLAESATVH
jgi:hypothetical protein